MGEGSWWRAATFASGGVLALALCAGMLRCGAPLRLDDANVEATRILLERLEVALGAYARTHGGTYPATLAALGASLPDPGWPTDAWGNAYVYTRQPDGRGYTLISLGKDGKPGGKGMAGDLRVEGP